MKKYLKPDTNHSELQFLVAKAQTIDAVGRKTNHLLFIKSQDKQAVEIPGTI